MSKRTINDIATGKSKAVVINDCEIFDLFFNYEKIDHNVKSNNFEIRDNVLYHHSQIECIRRKKDGLIIKNSQEQFKTGGQFPHIQCPSLWKIKHIALPIEEIYNQVRSFPNADIISTVEKIEIIDNEDNYKEYDNSFIPTGVVFKLEDKYYWHKRDEVHYYLIQLPTKVSSIREAEDSLKPNVVLKSQDFKRQGDFYFLPVNEEFKEYDRLYYKKHFDMNYKTNEEFSTEIEILGDLFLWKLGELFQKTLDKNGEVVFARVIQDFHDNYDYYYNSNPLTYNKKQELEYIKNKMNELIPYTSKELIRYDILDSNHIADNSYFDGVNQFVKGSIRHKNKDHSPIKLDNWHLVLKNEALSGIEVDPNSQRRFD
ncbi:hypothetical protein [Serratia sp. (in: enterobacteria)]|uniref:hypothetical protein n=1 Tax=Serratia sp. (in: enterobacteria) TaxID=616 RepID=UPI003989B130